jgi:CRP/FNR family transcriptional regulator
MLGEMMELEAISTDVHTCYTMVLEVSETCEIPFSGLEEIDCIVPCMMHHFHKVKNSEIVHNHETITVLGGMKAREGLITHLLNLSDSFTKQGLFFLKFQLMHDKKRNWKLSGTKIRSC